MHRALELGQSQLTRLVLSQIQPPFSPPEGATVAETLEALVTGDVTGEPLLIGYIVSALAVLREV